MGVMSVLIIIECNIPQFGFVLSERRDLENFADLGSVRLHGNQEAQFGGRELDGLIR